MTSPRGAAARRGLAGVRYLGGRWGRPSPSPARREVVGRPPPASSCLPSDSLVEAGVVAKNAGCTWARAREGRQASAWKEVRQVVRS